MPPGVNQLPFFIENISVLNRRQDTVVDYKTLPALSLKPGENFFTVTLEAINYSNPGQTWYAYKLDGLETDWHYTQDPKAVYTSVPGGDYVFRYKAGAGGDNWLMPEKTLAVHVAKVFYKTIWFWTIIALLLLALLYLLYRYRLSQQQKVFVLEGKAQKLEKEKTQVMYESLKQQLNPHFLFNSLTSLSGLIETDQQLAGNFLKQMSKIYRYILKSRDSELVKLKEEIDFVQTYINLQQTRFKTGLIVNIAVENDAMNRKIPPVTLQNMIENAIKHNVIDAETPLVIRVASEGEYLVIRNNLQKKHMVETSNKQGLVSLKSLYSYLSKKPVLVEETETDFIIQLPLI
ncbi:MAG: histidine kinase [Ferruginibacter sp.]